MKCTVFSFTFWVIETKVFLEMYDAITCENEETKLKTTSLYHCFTRWKKPLGVKQLKQINRKIDIYFNN